MFGEKRSEGLNHLGPWKGPASLLSLGGRCSGKGSGRRVLVSRLFE